MSKITLCLAFPGLGKSFFAENSKIPVIDLHVGAINKILDKLVPTHIKDSISTSMTPLYPALYSVIFKYIELSSIPEILVLCPAVPEIYTAISSLNEIENFFVLVPKNTEELKKDFNERYKARINESTTFNSEALNQILLAYETSWDQQLSFFQEEAQNNKNIIFTDRNKYLTDYLDITTGQPTTLLQKKLRERKNQD